MNKNKLYIISNQINNIYVNFIPKREAVIERIETYRPTGRNTTVATQYENGNET